MRHPRVLLIGTLASLASAWSAADAQAQYAIKLFDATPLTQSAPCADPLDCDPARERVVFDEATLVLSCKAHPRAVLSSTTDGFGPLVVDNFVEVNGMNVCAGGASADGVEQCFNEPASGSIGMPTLEAFPSVPPLDVSHLLPRRARARTTFSLVDYGGVYANSDVWLVTNCTTRAKVDICHKPGTKAEKIVTVSQSAIDGHLGHGDTLDLLACHRRRPAR